MCDFLGETGREAGRWRAGSTVAFAGAMVTETLVVTDFQTNLYIVTADRPPGSGERGQCVLIDPGGEADLILARLRHLRLRPQLIVNTHGHADHIGANAELKRAFPESSIAVGHLDAPLLRSPVRNMALFFGRWVKSPQADRLLSEGDLLEAAGVRLLVRELPGHTRGHICLLAETETPPVVFCGDTLFAGGIGRTDLPGGSHRVLLEGIDRVLLSLPPETVLYPGHGPATTVGAERTHNPFLRDLHQHSDHSPERSPEP